MIAAKDLRISNWVKYNDLFHQIKDVDFVSTYLKVFEPIELTESVLEKCGFKKEEYCYANEYGVKIFMGEETFYHINDSFLIHFDYVHQLQNWYYFNTNEELEIQLT